MASVECARDPRGEGLDHAAGGLGGGERSESVRRDRHRRDLRRSACRLGRRSLSSPPPQPTTTATTTAAITAMPSTTPPTICRRSVAMACLLLGRLARKALLAAALLLLLAAGHGREEVVGSPVRRLSGGRRGPTRPPRRGGALALVDEVGDLVREPLGRQRAARRASSASTGAPLGSSSASMPASENGWIGSRWWPMTSAGVWNVRRSVRCGADAAEEQPWITAALGPGSWRIQSTGRRRGRDAAARGSRLTPAKRLYTGSPKVSAEHERREGNARRRAARCRAPASR